MCNPIPKTEESCHEPPNAAGVLVIDPRAVSRGGLEAEAGDLGRILCQHGLQPEVCGPAADQFSTQLGAAVPAVSADLFCSSSVLRVGIICE